MQSAKCKNFSCYPYTGIPLQSAFSQGFKLRSKRLKAWLEINTTAGNLQFSVKDKGKRLNRYQMSDVRKRQRQNTKILLYLLQTANCSLPAAFVLSSFAFTDT